MLRTNLIQLAKNLPLLVNIAEDDGVDSGTSFIIRSAKNM